MNFQEAMDFIEQAGQYGIVPGLDSIRELCRKLGNPQQKLEFVHVSGTNGKGSVTAYIASVLQCGGYRVGMYVSPAVQDFREIIQVNGCYITKAALCRHMEQVKAACDTMVEDGLPHPTPFEIETAVGFLYYTEKKCDIVVMETGMGGSLDATNVVENTKVAVIASVSRDHMKYLGETLTEIAAQKAGIIKKGCRVAVMGQKEEVLAVIAQKAASLECPLSVADSRKAKRVHYGPEKQYFDYEGLEKVEINLAGQYQIDNAVLALEALKALREAGFPVTEKKLRLGMAQAKWPGRFTVVGKRPYFIVDGAHNEDAAARLAQSLEYYFPKKRIIYIMGMLADKEYEKVIDLTHALADQIITVTPPGTPRAMPAYQLAQEVAKVHQNVTAVDSLEEAVEMSRLLAGKGDVIVAFGSLSFLGRLIKVRKEVLRQQSALPENF